MKAVEIFDGHPDNQPHKGKGPVLLDLARCEAAAGNNDEAESRFQQAVAVFEEYAGGEHPNTGHGLHHQAAFWRSDRSKQEKCVAQLKRAAGILKRSLGEEHEWTKEAFADLESAHSRRATPSKS